VYVPDIAVLQLTAKRIGKTQSIGSALQSKHSENIHHAEEVLNTNERACQAPPASTFCM